jgi:hypothetical protein
VAVAAVRLAAAVAVVARLVAAVAAVLVVTDKKIVNV